MLSPSRWRAGVFVGPGEQEFGSWQRDRRVVGVTGAVQPVKQLVGGERAGRGQGALDWAEQPAWAEPVPGQRAAGAGELPGLEEIGRLLVVLYANVVESGEGGADRQDAGGPYCVGDYGQPGPLPTAAGQDPAGGSGAGGDGPGRLGVPEPSQGPDRQRMQHPAG